MKRNLTDERQELLDLVEELGMRPATSHPIQPQWLMALHQKVDSGDIPSMKYFHLDNRVDTPEKTGNIIEQKFDWSSYAWKIFKYPMIRVIYNGEENVLERRFFQHELFAMSRIHVYKQGFGLPKTKFEEVFIKKGIDRDQLDEIAIKLKLWFGSPCSF